MRRHRLSLVAGAVLALATLYACDRLPGRPTAESRPVNPSKVTDFAVLYGENCAGCHGANGNYGGALPLNNAVYLTIVDDASMRDAISNGVAGTSMPAFAINSGGLLTDEQIGFIVSGIRSRWGKDLTVAGAPSYLSEGTGNPIQGAKLFGDYCASCHGVGGTTRTAGAITAPSFLALYSDQTLRTLIIAGRPDLSHPGWRDYADKAPLNSAQISDLIAWFATKRGS